MTLPDFIKKFPALDLPFPDDVVSSNAVQSDAGLVVFFTFHQDMVLPPHSHKAQWGILVAGEIELTIGGKKRTYRPGDSYSIPEGVEHGAIIKAGSVIIDAFEEPDRYPIRRQVISR